MRLVNLIYTKINAYNYILIFIKVYRAMLEWIVDSNTWLVLGTLTILEIILGIDNIIFLSLVVSKLPKIQQEKARCLGLAMAMLIRLALLSSITWVIRLTHPLFSIMVYSISARDLILLFGGFFLIWKASTEIYNIIKGLQEQQNNQVHGFRSAMIKIILLDIIFSLDSVITAVGLSDHLFIMMVAVIAAVVVMMYVAMPLGELVNNHLSIKVLTLAFLILVGFTLMLECFKIYIPKGYIYFAMFFSMAVEILNLMCRKTAGISQENNMK